MRDGNFEQIIILVVVMLAWLVNFVMDLVRSRGRPAPPQEREAQAGRPRDRRQAIVRWAKSWQTPRRRAITSDTGVSTVVAPGRSGTRLARRARRRA